MRRSRFLLTLFSAGLTLAAACGDAVSPKSPSASTPSGPTETNLVTLSGSVHLTGTKLNPLFLSTADGQDIPLIGENANALASVENAGVDVRGEWDGDGAFLVSDFLVRTMGGDPVIDGILVAEYDILTDLAEPIGYGVRPTRGGPDIMLAYPSDGLLAHVNERIWVAVDDANGAPTAFGVIQKVAPNQKR